MSYKYTDDELIIAIKTSISLAETLRKLNLSDRSNGNRKNIKIKIKLLNIDITHWRGRSANIGKTNNSIKDRRALSELLIENAKLTDHTLLKKRLLEAKLLIYECSICKISTWLDNKLVLQMDHINGINNDNRLENIRLLCPNCHSQTDTFCGKNKNAYDCNNTEDPRYEKHLRTLVPCPTSGCFNNKKREATTCKKCSIKFVTSESGKKQIIDWPEINELIKMVEETSYVKVAKKLNTTTTRIFDKIKKYKQSIK